jgi:5-methylcytosine-specific restriction enzyme subunit McrC
MEVLFEKYVQSVLQHQLSSGYKLLSQTQSEYLVTHKDARWFQLKPDLLIQRQQQRIAVLDTKWKLLDGTANNAKDKYKIKQADLYQLYAYGQKYLNGEGNIFLIYPAHEKFSEPLPVFSFDDRLKLWAIPFDLEADELVTGDWCSEADWLKGTDRIAA